MLHELVCTTLSSWCRPDSPAFPIEHKAPPTLDLASIKGKRKYRCQSYFGAQIAFSEHTQACHFIARSYANDSYASLDTYFHRSASKARSQAFNNRTRRPGASGGEPEEEPGPESVGVNPFGACPGCCPIPFGTLTGTLKYSGKGCSFPALTWKAAGIQSCENEYFTKL